MRDINKMSQDGAKLGYFTFQNTREFITGMMSLSQRCSSYDAESRSHYDGFHRTLNSLTSFDEPGAGHAWVIAEVRKAVSDPNYSADLGPYRLGPGGVGSAGTTAGQTAATTAPTGNGPIGYRTQIANMILPASFHNQFTARGLPMATCEAQTGQYLGIARNLPDNGMRAGYIKIAAAVEVGMAIYKQCEDDPAAWGQIQQWQQQHAQALKNCEGVSTVPSSCYEVLRP